MDKQIPIYFDSVIVASPIERISDSNPNLGRLNVGVFTKYGNRNGSYITDEVANQLIQSATTGDTPVVGFFDPETQTWAGHTGPTLASAYGYVESFVGWQPLTDTDGIERDYAVFSVVMFNKYFDEASKVIGQNQSMELDINSINGDWVDIEDTEYFVYTTAKIQGLCIIGNHEPCFSVSSFFSKNDANYESQYEKFASLLSSLKQEVEEASKGGTQTMNEFENVEVTPVVEEPQQETSEVVEEVVEPAVEETPVEFEETKEEETVVEEEVVAEETAAETEEVAAAETISEFDVLQQSYNELQAKFEQLQADYTAAQQRISELEQFQNAQEQEKTQLQADLTAAQETIVTYELERKNNLIERYKKVLNDEQISEFTGSVNNFNYSELESKLAIIYANSNMQGEDNKKVPLPEVQESSFALLMKKYKK